MPLDAVGSAILPELRWHGHSVVALARSDRAEQQVLDSGADVIRGDLRRPEAWSKSIHEVDAVIHVAATFTDDMGDVDTDVIEELVTHGAKVKHRIRFIYIGGTWLYGQTGDDVATESSPFYPISRFTWMARNCAIILTNGRLLRRGRSSTPPELRISASTDTQQ